MKKQYIIPKTISANIELEELVATSFDINDDDSEEQWSRLDIGWEEEEVASSSNKSNWNEW